MTEVKVSAVVWDEFIRKLINVEDFAHRLGYHETGHALNAAKQKAGYERERQLIKQAAQPVSKMQREFLALQPGDKVLIQFPWNDAKRRGGRIVQGTVTRICGYGGLRRTFAWRRPDGNRTSQSFASFNGDCYHTIMPLDREAQYDPRRGIVFVRRPIGWHRKKLR